MSKLLSVLYEVAEIRAGCRRVHDERFGLSPRTVLRALSGRASDASASQCAELRHLSARLEQARTRLEQLDAEDLAIRQGDEINQTLCDYVEVLSRSLANLEALCAQALVEPAGHDLVQLKVAYDDVLQQQKRLAARLNALIERL
jgi:hypothetical protein